MLLPLHIDGQSHAGKVQAKHFAQKGPRNAGNSGLSKEHHGQADEGNNIKGGTAEHKVKEDEEVEDQEKHHEQGVQHMVGCSESTLAGAVAGHSDNTGC